MFAALSLPGTRIQVKIREIRVSRHNRLRGVVLLIVQLSPGRMQNVGWTTIPSPSGESSQSYRLFAASHASSGLFSAMDEPHRKLPLALDVDDPAGFAVEVVVDQVVGFLCDLD
jgi:hypothetical protein